MRYPIIFLILLLLIAALPLQRQNQDHSNRKPVAINYVLSEEHQQSAVQWLDKQTETLRNMPPLHQLMLMSTAIILVINAAIVVAYLINSVAGIAGIGISLAALLPLLLIAGTGLLFGWQKPRRALLGYMKKHGEFGPFVSKFTTRMWKRRFRIAQREHGFITEY